MPRLIKTILILSSLCGLALAGCFGPGYAPTYGYPSYGYAPYSYGWYARGYRPDFILHHPWEEHHAPGHNVSFFRPSPAGGPGPSAPRGEGPGPHGGGRPGR